MKRTLVALLGAVVAVIGMITGWAQRVVVIAGYPLDCGSPWNPRDVSHAGLYLVRQCAGTLGNGATIALILTVTGIALVGAMLVTWASHAEERRNHGRDQGAEPVA